MKHQRHFVGRLELYELEGHGGMWFCVMSDLTFVDDTGSRYTAKAGTLTDFASVPRIVWRVIPKLGAYNRATVIHDAMCSEKWHRSRFVHDLFLRMMETCGVSWPIRVSMWRMVRWFGPRFDGA